MPRPSRSVSSTPTNDRPRSRLARATNTVEANSCGANDDAVGTRQDDRAAAIVLDGQGRVADAGRLARDARTPGRRGDRAACRRPGSASGTGPTLSRKKGRFSGTNRANRSFAEICATSDSTCEKSGLTVTSTAVSELGANFTSRPTSCARSFTRGEPRPAAGRALRARADVRSGDQVTAGRQPLQSLERVGVADKAVEPARHPRRQELVVTVARIVAVEQDGPRLRVAVLVPERRERDAHLERPSALGDLRRRLPEEVG